MGSPLLAAEPQHTVPVLELDQSHFFLGDLITKVGPRGIRMESVGSFKFVLVSHAPNWRITVFRNDDKTYFSESLKEFVETGLVSGFLVGRRERYWDPTSMHKSPLKLYGFPGMRSSSNMRILKYLPLPKGTSQEVELIIYSAYKMTTNGGIPVELLDITPGRDWVSGEDRRNKLCVFISTRSIKSVNLPVEIFEAPKNYTKANSLREVVSGAASRKESEDAQELFKIREHK